jgi:hypothetical protein
MQGILNTRGIGNTLGVDTHIGSVRMVRTPTQNRRNCDTRGIKEFILQRKGNIV